MGFFQVHTAAHCRAQKGWCALCSFATLVLFLTSDEKKKPTRHRYIRVWTLQSIVPSCFRFVNCFVLFHSISKAPPFKFQKKKHCGFYSVFVVDLKNYSLNDSSSGKQIITLPRAALFLSLSFQSSPMFQCSTLFNLESKLLLQLLIGKSRPTICAAQKKNNLCSVEKVQKKRQMLAQPIFVFLLLAPRCSNL